MNGGGASTRKRLRKVIRLDDLSLQQRAVILALIEAAKARKGVDDVAA